MALDGKLLARARDRLAARRQENEELRLRREREVYARAPEIARIDRGLRELLRQVVAIAAGGRERAAELDAIERQSLELCAEKAEALTERGYPPDYLDTPLHCRRCGDLGYRKDGSLCDCLLELYEDERAKELSAAAKIGEESFSDFDLSYYTGAARECMELTYQTCRAYAEGFGPASPNLLFQGGTGLGKTFLAGCVARTVSRRGFPVVYETAQGAFGAFEEQKFSRDAETYAAATEKVRRILGCRLLVLDDLGTELTTSFTQSALYNILDTRLTEGNKTLVTTNLSDAELSARYIPQIVSRLGGEFDTLLFMGRDIRGIRKERRYL